MPPVKPPVKKVRKAGWRKRATYTSEDLEKAVEAVKNGLSMVKASKRFGVPRITILDAVHKKHRTGQDGRKPEMSKEEEEKLVSRAQVKMFEGMLIGGGGGVDTGTYP